MKDGKPWVVVVGMHERNQVSLGCWSEENGGYLFPDGDVHDGADEIMGAPATYYTHHEMQELLCELLQIGEQGGKRLNA